MIYYSDKNDSDGEVKFWKKNLSGDEREEEEDTEPSKPRHVKTECIDVGERKSDIKPEIEPIIPGMDQPNDFKIPLEKSTAGIKREVRKKTEILMYPYVYFDFTSHIFTY